mgnify:CR=1 FL=1
MDIQLEKRRIVERLIAVEEEWVIRSIKRLLNIEDASNATALRYESDLKPMSREELINRARQAEADIEAGNVIDLETYLEILQREP